MNNSWKAFVYYILYMCICLIIKWDLCKLWKRAGNKFCDLNLDDMENYFMCMCASINYKNYIFYVIYYVWNTLKLILNCVCTFTPQWIFEIYNFGHFFFYLQNTHSFNFIFHMIIRASNYRTNYIDKNKEVLDWME